MDQHYIVSARKYRPSTFDSVVGQRALTDTLKNAVASGRLAHAYLFCGGRGVGKTSCARIFAKTINCAHPTAEGEACNECESCRQFNDNRSMNIIELDAASHNGIDDIKALIDQVQVPPTLGRYRVFIIDEVHMLSQAAFNAFLKTLEEPPEHAIFILATTEKHKIIPTILSRCQIYDFSRISTADMVAHMQHVASQEGIEAEASALGVIARQADGAMRDALSIFDQVAASSRGHITYQSTIESLNVLDDTYYQRLMEAFLQGDVPETLLIYKEVREKGFDSLFFLQGLAQYIRDLMVAADPRTRKLLDAAPEVVEQMAQMAARTPVTFYYKAMALINEADMGYRTAGNKQFLLELTLIRLCQLFGPSPSDTEVEGLKKVKSGEGRAERPQPHSTAPTTPITPITPITPTPKPRPTIKAPSLKAPKPTVVVNAPAAPVAPQPQTTVDAPQAWKDYIAAHPSSQALTGCMATASVIADGDTLHIGLGNDTQLAMIKEASADIEQYIRNATGHQGVTLLLKIIDNDGDPVTWTQSQVLENMVKHHPEMASVMQQLQLTLQ